MPLEDFQVPNPGSPPVFATQGADVGKTRGRKPKVAGKAEASSSKAPHVKASSSKKPSSKKPRHKNGKGRKVRKEGKAVTGKKKTGKAKAEAVQRYKTRTEASSVQQPAANVAIPSHVTGHHVYSNAYRKALSDGLSQEQARLRGRETAAKFRETGTCDPEMVGKLLGKLWLNVRMLQSRFRLKPRKD